jgi:poly(glycerol-phosphate) alpha-glucosyltransferase
LCDAEARSIRAYGLTNPVCVIPNGVDLPEPVPSWTGKTQAAGVASSPAGRKVLLYLGRLHPKKGLLNLLRAWRLALNRKPSIRERWMLSIVGWDESGHESELKRLADDLQIPWTTAADGARAAQWNGWTKQSEKLGPASVLFSGPQFGEDKSESYRCCDAFILPSFSEGLPMVVLEAWSYARPVLMTPECHLPQGFSAGAAFPMEANVESIAATLLQLFEMSDNERTAMGRRGFELVRDHFAWPEIAERMRQAYEWVLGGGQKPGFVV